MSKIKKLDDIRQRCVVDGKDWIWRGATNSTGTPVCKYDGAVTTVLRLAYEFRHGKGSAGPRVWPMDRNMANVNPSNAMTGTIAEHNAFKAEGGRLRGLLHQIASTRARDKLGRMFTPDQAAEIRNAPGTESVLAERFGCSKALIGMIRRGEIYRATAAKSASVFDWRPS